MQFGTITTKIAIATGALALASGFSVLSFAGTASATSPTTGSVLPNSVSAIGTHTAGAPFSSGQTIEIQVPANSILVSTKNVNIVECTAPGGVVPTDPGSCDGNTIQGGSIKPLANGSIDYKSYTVYAIPNTITLGENSGGPECDLNSQCILYIGNDQGDFTQPHYWSQPFWVKPNADDGGENPGDGTPEVPYALILPVAALGVFGAGIMIRRRRHSVNA